MRPELKIILLASLFASLASAVNYEEQTLNFTVSEVPGLITVATNINTTNLLPGYEYSYDLSILWGVPPESLRNINADSVSVYVKIQPKANVTNVYFRDPLMNRTETVRYFDLNCIIANSTCARNSTLLRSTPVFYTIIPGKNISLEQLVVTAQLLPFANESEIADANASINDANSTISELNASGLNTTNETLILFDALQRFSDGDYKAAKELAEMVSALRGALATPTPAYSPTPEPPSPMGNFSNLGPLAYVGIIAVLLLLALLFMVRRGKKPGLGR